MLLVTTSSPSRHVFVFGVIDAIMAGKQPVAVHIFVPNRRHFPVAQMSVAQVSPTEIGGNYAGSRDPAAENRIGFC